MPYTVNGVSYTYRRPLYANTVGLSACADLPLPFVGPNLTGKALANLNDVVLTEADGTTLLGNVGDGSFRGWWEAKTITAPVGHGQFDLAGGGAAELVAYLYYGGAGAADLTNQAGTYPTTWKGFWALNEASGTLADATGNGHTGTAYGSLTYGAIGQVDGALGFDGVNDYVNVPTLVPAGIFRAAHTMMGWTSLTNWGASRTMFGAGRQGGWVDCYVEIDFSASDKRIWGRVRLDQGPSNVVPSILTYLNDSAQHHFALVVNAALAIVGFYIDGVLQGANGTYSGTLNNLDAYHIGDLAYPLGPNINPWQGTVDNHSVIAANLSASEVLASYRAGAGTLWTWGEEETAAGGGLPLLGNRLGRMGPSLAGTR
jgi:hypothetical protein